LSRKSWIAVMAESFLRDDLADIVPPGPDPARALLLWARTVADSAAPADVYRHKEGRKTLRFDHAGRSYFLKLHSGIGWAEVVKNLAQLRLPVIGAGNEYRAITALQRIGVDTLSVAAYASQGANPAQLQSLLITDDLVDTVSLEDYCAQWAVSPPPVPTRLQLIAKLADSAGRMHRAGINHRDFYLCHFHLDRATLADATIRCYLIDLHRAQCRRQTPRRWQVKDLAGLYFSAMDCGLTQRDLLRFIRLYTPGGLRVALRKYPSLWRDAGARAERLYRRQHGTEPPTPGGKTGQ
jgi:heptose I phosphotransferase